MKRFCILPLLLILSIAAFSQISEKKAEKLPERSRIITIENKKENEKPEYKIEFPIKVSGDVAEAIALPESNKLVLHPLSANFSPIKTFFSNKAKKLDFKDSVDLSIYLPEVGDQDNGTCCSSFAAAWAMKTISANKLKGFSRNTIRGFKQFKDKYTYSPAFTNVTASELAKSPCETGANLDYAIEALQTFGAILLKDIRPPAPEMCYCNDIKTDVTTKIAVSNTIWNRESWGKVNDTIIWNKLISGKPVGIELMVPGNFNELGEHARYPFILDMRKLSRINKNFILHSMVIVGYNRRNKLYKVVNSYGPNWGNKGFAYLPFGFFKDYTGNSVGVLSTSPCIKFITFNEKDPLRKYIDIDELLPEEEELIDSIEPPFKRKFFIAKGKYVTYGSTKIGCIDLLEKDQITSLAILNSKNGSLITKLTLQGRDSILLETPELYIKLVQMKFTSSPLHDYPIEAYMSIYIEPRIEDPVVRLELLNSIL